MLCLLITIPGLLHPHHVYQQLSHPLRCNDQQRARKRHDLKVSLLKTLSRYSHDLLSLHKYYSHQVKVYNQLALKWCL